MKLTSNTILITGGANGIGYELTKQLTALVTRFLSRAAIKLRWIVRKRPFQTFTPFEATFPDPKAIATLYEEVTNQFPELNIFDQQRRHHA